VSELERRARGARLLREAQRITQTKAFRTAKTDLGIESWLWPLERLRGQIADDGLERITTQAALDVLEIPQRSRRAGTCRRLAKLMTELGWTAVRVRGVTRGGYLEQVRGFCRSGAAQHDG
jgi:hypothetical protein